MKKLNTLKTLSVAAVIGLFISNAAWAKPCPCPPPLDQVAFSLSAQEWAKTDTAKITVVVNAALNKTALAQMREQIMGNLNKIAKGNWHITDFERSLDSSGLEKLYVEAEARVSESALTNVNAQAKSISRSGMDYKVQNVDFTPSLADIEKVKESLRKTIYREAQAEIKALNELYPNQSYSLHGVRFGEMMVSGGGVRTQMMMVTGAAPRANVSVNTVSSLITLTADVDLASERKKSA